MKTLESNEPSARWFRVIFYGERTVRPPSEWFYVPVDLRHSVWVNFIGYLVYWRARTIGFHFFLHILFLKQIRHFVWRLGENVEKTERIRTYVKVHDAELLFANSVPDSVCWQTDACARTVIYVVAFVGYKSSNNSKRFRDWSPVVMWFARARFIQFRRTNSRELINRSRYWRCRRVANSRAYITRSVDRHIFSLEWCTPVYRRIVRMWKLKRPQRISAKNYVRTKVRQLK